MRNTLRKIGIAETDFIRACNASFKQGAKFARWRTGKADDAYYHPLVLPQGFPDLDLAPYWHEASAGGEPYPIPMRFVFRTFCARTGWRPS
jgi:hypothetical protein